MTLCYIQLILEPPEITSGPQDVEVSWGETAVFTCRVDGDPRPSVFWMRDDQEIDVDGEKYRLMEDGSLMIQNTEPEDSGYYECMVKSQDGITKSRPARMVVKSNEVLDGKCKLQYLC